MLTNQNAGGGQSFDRMVSVKEVAEVFSISVRTVWRRVDEAKLPKPVKDGRLTRWFNSEVQQVLEGLKQQRKGKEGGKQ